MQQLQCLIVDRLVGRDPVGAGLLIDHRELVEAAFTDRARLGDARTRNAVERTVAMLDTGALRVATYDERTNLGQQVARDIRAFFQERVYTTVIPRNVRLGEAPSHGLPAVLYDVKSRGAEAYLALAREFLARDTASATTPEPQHG